MYSSNARAPDGDRGFGVRVLRLTLIMLALATLSASAATSDAVQRERLARIRVPFVENCGQWDETVAFAATASFGTVFVTNKGQLVYSLPRDHTDGWTLTETLVSGKPAPRPGQPAVTRVSYFHGNDRSRWQTGLSSYDEVGLGEVWPGISVALRVRASTIEKIFTVEPGAKAERIRLRVEGARSLRIDGNGALVVEAGLGSVRFTRPEAYQEHGGTRHPVEVAYVLHGHRYGFRLGSHDHALPVVIDPLLQATYLGGSVPDWINAIVVHPSTGEVFVSGGTWSPDFPGMTGGAQSSYGGCFDAFVARLDSVLATLLQATYLGGGLCDEAHAVAVHPLTGEILVAGMTQAIDFPGTTGGAQPTYGGGFSDGFAARLDSSLASLLQATYLGGSSPSGLGGACVSYGFASFPEQVQSIAVNPSTGDVYAGGCTKSTDFPGTVGGAQPTYAGGDGDGFVARLSSTLTTLLQSTYLGGSNSDKVVAIAVDPGTGDILAAGPSWSPDFPGTTDGAQVTLEGASDGFVSRISPNLTTLLQSSYLGGSGVDEVTAITFHAPTNEVFTAGWTQSTDFPGTGGGAQAVFGGGLSDGFIARFNSSLTSLSQATYLGGSQGYFYLEDQIEAIAVQPATGEVFISGWTDSADFPGTAGGAQANPGDGFVARLDMALTNLLQATYLGQGTRGITGIAVHPATGDVLVAGTTDSPDFPGTAGGAQPDFGGVVDGFVARLTPDLAALLAPVGLTVDSLPNPGDGDFVFEPGETAAIIPSWENLSTFALTPSGQASEFTGPPGATYTILNDSVSYGTIPPGGVGLAGSAYSMSISVPAIRPATHWDAWFTETLDVQYVLPFRHVLHIGDSFPDVARSNLFYRFIENVLHHGITAGCGSGNYCPDSSVTRAQMAVFLLKSKHGSAFVPPACGGVFADVICPSQFADWIEELAAEGITGGCGGGNYCPDNPVTRAQMAVFLLKAQHGSAYTPPPCAGLFGDVTCPSLFADWIEQLAAEGITGGCGGGNYCPNNSNTRGQMAPFLAKTFGLQLYGP